MTDIERDDEKPNRSRRSKQVGTTGELPIPETADELRIPETADRLAIPEGASGMEEEVSAEQPLAGIAVSDIEAGEFFPSVEIDDGVAEASLDNDVGDCGAASSAADALAVDALAVDVETELEAETEFLEHDRALSLIESLLFVSDRPVTMAAFKQLFKGTNIRTKDIARALDLLASEYASASRGISLEEIHGGYQLRTKVDNADFLRRLAKTRPFRLSGPALEALAIVAYKQPIVKAEVDQLRGVESGHLLRALMERGLVNFAGKSELPGKPMQYGTTRKFLEVFGLRNLKELPTLSEIDDLIPEGIGEEPEQKPVLADITRTMAQDTGATYSDGEEELGKITEQLQSIDASSEFFEQEKQRQREARDLERAQNIREALEVGEAVEDKDRRWLERYDSKALDAADGPPSELNSPS